MTLILLIIGIIAIYFTYKTLISLLNTCVYNSTKGIYGVKMIYSDYLILSIILWGIFIYYLNIN